MNCTQSEDLLQQRLDGEAIDDRAALEQHLAGCAACRSLHAAAGRLEDGLRLLAPPVPPLGLRKSIAAAALDDRQSRQRARRRWLTAAALAACLFIAILTGYATTHHDDHGWSIAGGLIVIRPEVTPPMHPIAVPNNEDDPPQTPTPSLRESVAVASAAVVSLTRRTADETREQTRILTEALPMPSNVFEAMPSAQEQSMPAVFQETGSRVATGFEPVTSSARRAFSMFLREAPAASINQ